MCLTFLQLNPTTLSLIGLAGLQEPLIKNVLIYSKSYHIIYLLVIHSNKLIIVFPFNTTSLHHLVGFCWKTESSLSNSILVVLLLQHESVTHTKSEKEKIGLMVLLLSLLNFVSSGSTVSDTGVAPFTGYQRKENKLII